ncbi:MAG: restriction endonuclease [Actinomycetota bacterium]|nr:restriction endonuclease [Actinomycetota bacterium]
MDGKDRSDWEALEIEVGSLYRSLGYTVSRDELLAGHQIDLLATKTTGGAGIFRLGIEVKYRQEGSLPLQEVTNFIATAKHLLSDGTITSATLVTNVSLTRNSKVAIRKDNRLHLTTLDELRRAQLFNEETLRDSVNAYKRDRLLQRFIDMAARRVDTIGPAILPPTADAIVVTELLDHAMALAGKGPLVLFADYGGGKTTALRRLKFLTLERVLSQDARLLPILFMLGELLEHQDLETFISHTLRREFGMACDKGLFWELVDQGKFLLLLDGFDEIAVQPTRPQRTEFMRRLSPLMFGASPAIVSSRPSYFTDLEEYREMIATVMAAGGLSTARNRRRKLLSEDSTRLITQMRMQRRPPAERLPADPTCVLYELLPLDRGRIDAYLDALEGDFAGVGVRSTGDVARYLDEVYDLSDLVTRPLILEMVVDTILLGALDIYSQRARISAAELYEIYIELKFHEDRDKGPVRQGGLTFLQRREYAEWCAWQMNRTSTLELTIGEASKLIPKVIRLRKGTKAAGDALRVDALLTDLRTCSFMTTTPSGGLRFVHKSFLEFFLASRLREALVSADPVENFDVALPTEALYFLGSMTLETNSPSSGETYRALLTTIGHAARLFQVERAFPSTVMTNLLGLLLYSRSPISGVHVTNACGPRGIRRTALEIMACTFRGVDLPDIVLGTVKVVESVLRNVTVGGDISSVELISSEVDVTFEGNLSEIRFDGTNGRIRCTQASAVGINATQQSHMEVILDGSAEARSVQIEHSTAKVAGPFDFLSAIQSVVGVPATTSSKRSGSCALEVARSIVVINAGVDDRNLQYRPTGTFEDCLILVDPAVPLAVLLSVRMAGCILLGGYVDHDTSLLGPFDDSLRPVGPQDAQGVWGLVFVRGSPLHRLDCDGMLLSHLGILHAMKIPGPVDERQIEERVAELEAEQELRDSDTPVEGVDPIGRPTRREREATLRAREREDRRRVELRKMAVAELDETADEERGKVDLFEKRFRATLIDLQGGNSSGVESLSSALAPLVTASGADTVIRNMVHYSESVFEGIADTLTRHSSSESV